MATLITARSEGVGQYLNPAALVRNLWQHRDLIRQFTQREVEGRYRGSFLGLFWSFINPLVMLLIYTFVFGVVFKARWSQGGQSSLGQFALVLFCGLIPFNVFAECMNSAPTMIVGVPNYVKKVVFPLEILPVSVMGSALFHSAISLSILLVANWLIRGNVQWTLVLLPLVALPLLGAATFRKAAASYGDEFIFLFMGGFILALSMQRWGLDRRIALTTLRLVGSGPRAMVLGFMIATAMISGFVSNTATAAMMMPVGLSVIDLLLRRGSAGEAPDSQREVSSRNFALCLMLGIAYAASIGGVATIIGTPPNAFLVGFLKDKIAPEFRMEISFARWLTVGLPLMAVFIPLTWLLLTRVLYPIRLPKIEGGREFIRRELRGLGPMKAGESATFIVFTMAACAWMLRPILAGGFVVGEAPGQPPRVIIAPLTPGLSDAGIAMIAALLLFVIPVDRRFRGFTMNWEHARRLPWGILILFGGGLSLAGAIEANGVAEFLGGQAQRFAGMPEFVLVLMVVAAVVFFSEVASNTATAATLIPILAAMAPGLNVHPYMLAIPAGLAASLAFMLPVGTPPNAIVFGTGLVRLPQMMRAGFVLNLAGVLVITALLSFVIGPLLGRLP